MKTKTPAYYKGRESVWKDLYKGICNHAAALEEKLKPLQSKVFHETADRVMIANMTSQIDGFNQKLEAKEESILQLKREKYQILSDLMNGGDASAEDRLSNLRQHYKNQFIDLDRYLKSH